MQLVVVVLSGSVALLAETIHTFADAARGASPTTGSARTRATDPMPARTVAALAVVAILVGLLAVAVVMLARRSILLTIGVAVILLAAMAWVIFIWPAYWD